MELEIAEISPEEVVLGDGTRIEIDAFTDDDGFEVEPEEASCFWFFHDEWLCVELGPQTLH